MIITSVTIFHVLISILLIITVLLQPGKGDDLGTIFGGTSQSIFGASGAVPFLTKVTRILAVLFIITSLSLGYFSAKNISSSVVNESKPLPQTQGLTVPEEGQPSTKTETKSDISTEPGQGATPSQGKGLSSPQSEEKHQEGQSGNK